MPAVYKPTRITEFTASIIDNILTSSENIIKSSILVTDISDHFPTTLSINLDCVNISGDVKSVASINNFMVAYKRNHSNDNITKFKKKLMEVNWFNILDGNKVDDDYDKFIVTFDDLHNECIPMKKM